jgi:hypothetical protein
MCVLVGVTDQLNWHTCMKYPSLCMTDWFTSRNLVFLRQIPFKMRATHPLEPGWLSRCNSYATLRSAEVSGVWFPVVVWISATSTASRPALHSIQSPVQWRPDAGRETVHSLPCRAWVRNARNCTSTFPCIFMAYLSLLNAFCVVSDRLCGLVIRVPGYRREMNCVTCEVRTELYIFIIGFCILLRVILNYK